MRAGGLSPASDGRFYVLSQSVSEPAISGMMIPAGCFDGIDAYMLHAAPLMSCPNSIHFISFIAFSMPIEIKMMMTISAVFASQFLSSLRCIYTASREGP